MPNVIRKKLQQQQTNNENIINYHVNMLVNNIPEHVHYVTPALPYKKRTAEK